MAYELALMTFHYVPEVKNVAVLLPAVVKGKCWFLVRRADRNDGESASGSEVAGATLKSIGRQVLLVQKASVGRRAGGAR